MRSLTVFTLVLSLLALGCAQNTEPFSFQGEDTSTPTVQRITYSITNGPADSVRGTHCPPTSQPWEVTRESPESGEGTTKSKLPAGAYNQLVIIWTDTGAEAQTSGQQTGEQTTSPTQDVKADVGVTAMLQFLKGLVNQANASPAAAGTGGATSTATSNQELKDMLKDLFKDLLKSEPTTRPAEAPAPAVKEDEPAAE